MNAKIRNWRCIKEANFDLARINIFLGQNATGKSSLAYALYFLSKVVKYDFKKLLTMLYGCELKDIVRMERNKRCYPVEISAGKSLAKFGGRTRETPDESPWNDEFLLPSRRVAYFQALRILPRIAKEIQKSPDSGSFLPLIIGFIKPILEELPLFPPAEAFFTDLNKALTGYRIESIRGDLKSLGGYVVEVSPLLSLFEFTVSDPYTNLKLPPEMAPDGQVDALLINLILEKATENSLIVIEEPEIYKNPVYQFEIMEKILDRAINKNLTVVITTHSEIIPLSITKLVGEGNVSADDVRIYYLERTKEEPWTSVRKINVYEDGTLEELPDSEKITAYLF